MGHPAIEENFVPLHGVLDMFGALHYHFVRIMQCEVGLPGFFRREPHARFTTSSEWVLVEHARYEATAYLSVLGRFYYFARRFNVAIPTIIRLLVFRDKVAADRSVDAPRNEAPELLSLHALSLASTGGQLFTPIDGGGMALMYQIQPELGTTEDFVPRKDHTLIMNEAYAMLEHVFD